jgi:hypothetical protein
MVFYSEYQVRMKKICKNMRAFENYLDGFLRELVSGSVLTSRFPRLLGLPGRLYSLSSVPSTKEREVFYFWSVYRRNADGNVNSQNAESFPLDLMSLVIMYDDET